ncbi:MAG: phosphatase PAP2 family protein [Ferruginibacter sp.]
MIRILKHRIQKLSEAIALVSVQLFLVFIAFSVSLGLLIMIVREIFYEKENNIDNKVFDLLQPHVSDINTSIIQFFTFFGSQQFLVPAWLLFLIYYFFIRKNKWYFIKMLTISISTVALMLGLKLFFNRPRPLIPLLKEVPGLSFPSGHAFMSFVFFGMLIYLVHREVKNKWLKWILIFLLGFMIFTIGLTRVYLRVHYASDVLAGFCFGLMSLVILLWLLRRIEKFNEKELPATLNVTKPPEGLPSVKAGK